MRAIIKKHLLVLFFLFILVAVTYANSLRNDFISDDIPAIVNNPIIKKFDYIFSNTFFFARSIPFFIIYKIVDSNPIGFRLFNIFFHLGTVFVIYFLSLITTKNRTVSLFASAIFAVHPLLTESVTWISGGVYSQYSFFLLLSFLFYVLSVEKQIRQDSFRNVSIFFYAASLISFLFSLSSSEKSLILPFILLFYEISFGDLKKRWKKLILYFSIAFMWFMIFLLLRLGERVTLLETAFYQENRFRLRNPFIQVPIVIVSYLQLIAFPAVLTFFHTDIHYTYVKYGVAIFIFILFLISIFYSWRKSKPVFFWLSYFIITLIPTLTPFRLSSFVAERYVYAGTAGICIAFVYFINTISQRRSYVVFIHFFMVIVLGLFLVRTYLRNIDWKDKEHLWLATVKTAPSSTIARQNLADVLARKGDYAGAERELRKAIELNPYYADGYHSLGILYRLTERNDQALRMFQKSLELNPNLWQAHVNISYIYSRQKNYEKALEHLKQAEKLAPESSSVHRNLGITYLNLGQKEKALEEFYKTLELNPNDQTAKDSINKLKLQN
ncbi:tetratricopeptide repeat protein [Candidatus Roizmanbacteria bacterium]|nr:tetratricopeptide repeat protein [Candidatus Roizmanbacteria bacterium]